MTHASSTKSTAPSSVNSSVLQTGPFCKDFSVFILFGLPLPSTEIARPAEPFLRYGSDGSSSSSLVAFKLSACFLFLEPVDLPDVGVLLVATEGLRGVLGSEVPSFVCFLIFWKCWLERVSNECHALGYSQNLWQGTAMQAVSMW